MERHHYLVSPDDRVSVRAVPAITIDPGEQLIDLGAEWIELRKFLKSEVPLG
jgi:hypothetical protein